MNLNFMPKWNTGNNIGKDTHFVNKVLSSIAVEYFKKDTNIYDAALLKLEDCHERRLMHLDMNRVRKDHTIRKGNRWKKGDDIHFKTWIGKPYGKGSINYTFAPILKCVSVQSIEINSRFGAASMEVLIDGKLFGQYHYGNDRNINEKGLLKLAIKDGFNDIEDFHSYFDGDFKGQIIHWTDIQY